MSIPRNLEMAMLNAIHTSPINGNERPISLCYVAVRAVLEAQRGEYRTAVMQLGPRATSEPTPEPHIVSILKPEGETTCR